MDFASGNIFIRQHMRMRAGEAVEGHRHNFDHTTYVQAGAFRIDLLNDDGSVARSATVRATDEVNWVLIFKGREHRLTALEDGSRYQCIYSHREPQAISVGTQGQLIDPPMMHRDEQGHLWMRVDESIVQEATGWTRAYG